MEPQPSAGHFDQFQRRLQARLSPVAWQTWIEPLSLTLDDDRLLIGAPTDFHLRWIRDRFLDDIAAVGESVFGPDLAIEIDLVAGASAEPAPEPVATVLTKPAAPPVATADRDSHLVPKYVFENFVVGQSNRFAHAAAMAVAELPGVNYNPLFIYGGAGLGKTHLLHAVGHHARELNPTLRVRYVSSEQFFNEFINGIRRKRMDQFKARYRTIDVLLLDDVQFFEGKEQILEEFFHTFNTLHAAGKQLVISSDRPPKNLSTLEDRLRSRFEWGLITDIQPPDVETRLAILRRNAEYAPLPVPAQVLQFIATHVLDNIRELEGALTRVTAYAALTHEQITLEMAHTVLQDLVPKHESRPVAPENIIELTADSFGLTVADLVGPSRKQPLALARQIAMYLCRDLTDLSLPKIGTHFGGRDHTTVIHAVDRVRTAMQRDREIFDRVTVLSQKLRTT